MNNFKKKIAALAAATVMAVSCMSMGASADSWSLRYTPGATSSDNALSCKVYLAAGDKKITSIKESCTKYTTSTDSYGNISYAKYSGYSLTSSGEKISTGKFSTRYHYNTQPSHSIPLSSATPTYHTLVVEYKLVNTVNSKIAGTASKK
ncbi:MAG: hypothetical protein LUI06_03020 [Ruminococcus sp.]|nr:hypothetical protein [Ruminococcus sp.]